MNEVILGEIRSASAACNLLMDEIKRSAAEIQDPQQIESEEARKAEGFNDHGIDLRRLPDADRSEVLDATGASEENKSSRALKVSHPLPRTLGHALILVKIITVEPPSIFFEI